MTETLVTERMNKVTALESQVTLLLDEIKRNGRAKDAGYVSPDSETDRPEAKSFGDFLVAVQNKNKRRLREVYGSSYKQDESIRKLPKHVRTALAEDAGATGGYGVPTEYGELLLDMSREFNALREYGATVINMNRATMELPLLNVETAQTAGQTALAAGGLAYWTEEAAQITESEPRFKLLELHLRKLSTYSILSNEVRQDFAGLDGILSRALAKAVGSAEEYAFFRGDGAGKPLGILNSGCLLSPQRATANLIGLVDVSQMISDFLVESYDNAVWFMTQLAYDQLISNFTDPITWIPDMKTDWKQATLLGYPIRVVGCLPGLDTAGDIILADPSYYIIGDDPRGMQIAISDDYLFPYDRSVFRITKRVDGRPALGSAITYEDGSSTYSPFVVLAAGP